MMPLWKTMLRWLFVPVGVALAALLLNASTSPTVLGRYSTRGFTLIVLLALTLAGLVWARDRLPAWVERVPRTSRGRVVVLVVICVIAFALWAVPVATAWPYDFVRLAANTALVAAALWCADGAGWNVQPRVFRAVFVVVAALLAAATWLYPPVYWVDEGFVASGAWGLVTGRGWVPASLARVPTAELYSTMYAPLGAWYALTGGVSHWGTRLFFYGVGLASLGVLAVMLRRLHSVTATWLVLPLAACALLLLNYPRADIYVGVYLALAFVFLGLSTRTERAWPHLLVGLFVALTLDGHPNAYRFALAFGAVYAGRALVAWRAARRPHVLLPFVWLVVGGMGGAALYVGFFSLVTEHFGGLARAPFDTAAPANALVVLGEHLAHAARHIPVLLLAAVLGALAAWRMERGSIIYQVALACVLVGALTLALAYGYVRVYYLMQLVVPLTVLAAYGFARLLRADTLLARGLATAALAVGLAASAGVIVRGVLAAPSQDYRPALAVGRALREHVPQDAVFVGIDTFYFAMSDYPDFVDVAVGAWLAGQQGTSEADVWATLAPDAVAVVEHHPIRFDALEAHVQAAGYAATACWDAGILGRVTLYVAGGTPSDAPCVLVAR